uniref:Uncharacterized protein n=1 Tax=Plectus sambesii TaxID=2011161 RepID=A0A914VHW4_9BILA
MDSYKRAEKNQNQRYILSMSTNKYFLSLITVITYTTVLLWMLAFFITIVACASYVGFINAISSSFCSLLDGKCPPFVFMPFFGQLLSSTESQNTFCNDKRDALCHSDHNMTAYFILSIIACLISLIGLMNFLMCMVANVTRIRVNKFKFHTQFQRTDGDGIELAETSAFMNVKNGKL